MRELAYRIATRPSLSQRLAIRWDRGTAVVRSLSIAREPRRFFDAIVEGENLSSQYSIFDAPGARRLLEELPQISNARAVKASLALLDRLICELAKSQSPNMRWMVSPSVVNPVLSNWKRTLFQ